MLSVSVVISWLVVYFMGQPSELFHDEWLEDWMAWVSDAVGGLLGEVAALAVILLLPVIGFSLLLLLFGDWLFGLIGLLLCVFALLYSCGRYDYDEQLTAYKNALQIADETELEQTAMSFNIKAESASERHKLIREHFAYQSYQRWFAVVIWFLFLGVAGALFYRICQLCAAQKNNGIVSFDEAENEPSENNDAEKIKQYIVEISQAIVSWLDWLPLRLWVLCYALVGNFSAVITVFKTHFFSTESHLALLDSVHQVSLNLPADSVPINSMPTNDVSANGDKSFDTTQAYKEMDQFEALNSNVMIAAVILALVMLIVF